MLHIQKDTGVYLMTVNELEGFEMEEYCGTVTGNIIYGVNAFKDFRARLSDRFGGRVDSYESAMNDAIEAALRKMAKEAKKAGGNAVVGLRMEAGDLNGKMIRALCYGTAVKFKRRPKQP